jgi:membrane protein DedA with SNARE-associated domain
MKIPIKSLFIIARTIGLVGWMTVGYFIGQTIGRLAWEETRWFVVLIGILVMLVCMVLAGYPSDFYDEKEK